MPGATPPIARRQRIERRPTPQQLDSPWCPRQYPTQGQPRIMYLSPPHRNRLRLSCQPAGLAHVGGLQPGAARRMPMVLAYACGDWLTASRPAASRARLTPSRAVLRGEPADIASDAICDVLDRRLGIRASGDRGAASGAPIAGSMRSAPPDLAVAGDRLSILPSWRGRGGLSMSRWNRPSSLVECPPGGFSCGAEQVPPWLISGSGHAGPRPAPVAGHRAQPDVPAVAPNASPRPVRSTESRACPGTWSRNGRIASRAARISRPT